MKYIVRKAFWDYEKEEKWLNEMAAKGMALTDYSWCRYVFAESSPNEYTYRIELLAELPTHPESLAYIKFLEENGVEYIASYGRWIYLRKKAAEGEFEIYSDIESKIKHFQRINTFWCVLAGAELLIGLVNLLDGIALLTIAGQRSGIPGLNFFFGLGLMLLSVLIFRIGSPIRKKIRRLQQEKAIRE